MGQAFTGTHEKGETAGYWGRVDGADFCEPNYILLAEVGELFCAASQLLAGILPLLGLRMIIRFHREGHEMKFFPLAHVISILLMVDVCLGFVGHMVISILLPPVAAKSDQSLSPRDLCCSRPFG